MLQAIDTPPQRIERHGHSPARGMLAIYLATPGLKVSLFYFFLNDIFIIFKVIHRCILSMLLFNFFLMLEILVAILVILWLGGSTLHLGGDLIHGLLVIALVVLVYRLIKSA